MFQKVPINTSLDINTSPTQSLAGNALVRSVLNYGSPSMILPPITTRLFDPMHWRLPYQPVIKLVRRVRLPTNHSITNTSLSQPTYSYRSSSSSRTPQYIAPYSTPIHTQITADTSQHILTPRKIIRKKYSFSLPHSRPAGHPTLVLFLTRG